MYIYGKLTGAVLGLFIAGPIGFILGIAVGHFFDKGLELNERLLTPSVKLAQNVFFKTTFMIMGYIAKSDGRVSEHEIDSAKKVMSDLNLGLEERKQAIDYFNQGKSFDFNWVDTMDMFIKNCGYHPQLVQLFIEIQFKTAFAEGSVAAAKLEVLKRICQKLNVSDPYLSGMGSRFYSDYQPHQKRQTRSYSPPLDELANAYALLGVTKQSSDQEVKKAYRQLMSQNHPDKLVAKGLPEKMIKLATEKTQKIQKAYELICQARGI